MTSPALDAGLIDQDTYDAAVAGISAQVTGCGAFAQGQDAIAVGPGGLALLRDNAGTINLGVLTQQDSRPGASGRERMQADLEPILTPATA